MSFHNSLETIGNNKVVYFAVLFPAQAVEQQLLRHPHVAAAVKEHIVAAQAAGAPLNLKTEFHTTLQFFSPAKDPKEVKGLTSLLGQQVQVSILYVASTPRIAAARLNFVSPQDVALACSNACPHITLAVGVGAQAVWSNELLCTIENKQTAQSPRIADWRNARIVKFDDAENGMLPLALTGTVVAFVAGGRGGGGGGPRRGPQPAANAAVAPAANATAPAAAAASAAPEASASASSAGASAMSPPAPRSGNKQQQQQSPPQQQQQQQQPQGSKATRARKQSPPQQRNNNNHNNEASVAPSAKPGGGGNAAVQVEHRLDGAPTQSPMRREETAEGPK